MTEIALPGAGIGRANSASNSASENTRMSASKTNSAPSGWPSAGRDTFTGQRTVGAGSITKSMGDFMGR